MPLVLPPPYGHSDFAIAVQLALRAFLFYTFVQIIKMCAFGTSWAGETFGSMDMKAALGIAQTIGYFVGHWVEMLIVPKLVRRQLAPAAAALVLGSGGVLAVGCALPVPALPVCMFFSCVILANAWGLMVRFTEGRARTDAIVSMLNFTYIGMNGVVKATAQWLVMHGLSPRAMVAGFCLFAMAGGSVMAAALARVPPPSSADLALRCARDEMRSVRADGCALLARHGVGLSLVLLTYMVVGVLRTVRDYYEKELFDAVGMDDRPTATAVAELICGMAVLCMTGLLAFIADSWRALNVILVCSAMGGAMTAVVTLAWRAGMVGGFVWVLGVGMAIFVPYVSLGTVLFDRLLAAAHEHLTSSLIIIVGDVLVMFATVGALARLRARGQSGEADAGSGRDGGIAAFFADRCVESGVATATMTVLAVGAFATSITRALRAHGSGNANELGKTSPPQVSDATDGHVPRVLGGATVVPAQADDEPEALMVSAPSSPTQLPASSSRRHHFIVSSSSSLF